MFGLGLSASLPAVSRAQPAGPTIGFLSTLSPDEAAIHTQAFRRGLEETGYVEGRDIAIEYRWANGDYNRLSALAADLLSRPLALIVTPGDPAALAVKAAGLRIPDVFIVGQDPVRAGLVNSMNRPGIATASTSIPEIWAASGCSCSARWCRRCRSRACWSTRDSVPRRRSSIA